MKTKTDEYLKIICNLLDKEVKYLQRKNIAKGVIARLSAGHIKDAHGNIIEFKGGTLQSVLNHMMDLPFKHECRLETYPPKAKNRKISFYYLYKNRDEALEQMRQAGIISPSDSSSAVASPYIPSEYLLRHSEDVKRFLQQWLTEIPDVSTDFQCEEEFLPIRSNDVAGALTRWDCSDSIKSEKSDYFTSCIGHHGKLGSEIVSLWKELKENLRIFAEVKRRLINEIKELAATSYGVKYSSHGNEPSFTPSYVKRLYQYVIGCAEEDNDTVARIEDQSTNISYPNISYLNVKHPFLSVPSKSDIWLILPDNGEGVRLANGGVEALDRQLLANVKESLLESGSQIVVTCRENVRTRLDLIEKMERLLALPKLPGICPLLRESVKE